MIKRISTMKIIFTFSGVSILRISSSDGILKFGFLTIHISPPKALYNPLQRFSDKCDTLTGLIVFLRENYFLEFT
jgi:hypothetical protein